MKTSDLARLTEFREQISNFYRALDQVSSSWRSTDLLEIDGKDRERECQKHVAEAFEARNHIREQSRAIPGLIEPPPGQSSIQFLAGIRNDVENAWHLCRFMHTIDPDRQESEPDFERIRNEMHTLLPVYRENIWKAWRHIGHTIELAEPPEEALPSLNDKERNALEIIRERGPIKAISVAHKLKIQESTFRSHYLRKLRPHGVVSTEDGYVVRTARIEKP